MGVDAAVILLLLLLRIISRFLAALLHPREIVHLSDKLGTTLRRKTEL
jgi:hypothetical protein